MPKIVPGGMINHPAPGVEGRLRLPGEVPAGATGDGLRAGTRFNIQRAEPHGRRSEKLDFEWGVETREAVGELQRTDIHGVRDSQRETLPVREVEAIGVVRMEAVENSTTSESDACVTAKLLPVSVGAIAKPVSARATW